MAILNFTQLGALVLCYIVYRVVSHLLQARRLNNIAVANNCEKPYNLSGQWPLSLLDGVRRFRRILRMMETGEDILDDIFAEQFQHAHTIQSTMFEGTVQITTIEPLNLQAMLATQFKDFEMGQTRINQFFPILGNSIFSSDGKDWEHSRALFRPQFSREHINDLETTEETAVALINAIGPADSSGWTKPTELQPLMFAFTLDTATAFLFGESVKSLSLTANDGAQSTTAAGTKQFMEDFEMASIYMINRIRSSQFYFLVDGLQFRRAVNRIRTFTEQFVQKALHASPEEKAPAGKKDYDLLSSLATQTQDRTELRNQTLAILTAGRDTTASLLGWCFIRLTLHPEIFTTLRKTILQNFPADQPITFSSLKDCRYLRHFLNEVLRLHPTVPFNNRTAARDTTLPLGSGPEGKSPIVVAKGQPVNFSVYLMHRRKDLWGEDAEVFKPERWEQRIPPWQFLPFSGGPRICLGQQFALTEASYVIVRMLQHFDAIEAVDLHDMAKMKKGLGLTMWPGDQVKVRLHKAGV